MDEVERLVQLANERLRRGRVGVTLEIRGKRGWLYLRGTFPPKPASKKTNDYQQRVPLKMRATPAAIKKAQGIAKVVGGELNLGTFDWAKWSDAEVPNSVKTIEQWIQEFEEYFWRSRDRNDDSKQNTWKKAYWGPLQRLPRGVELTTDMLIDWIVGNSEPDTRMRGHYCTCAKELSKLAGLSTEVFKELNADPGIAPVNPRALPSDETIVKIRATIEDPGWQFLYGLMAAYGLRNHECFGVNFADFPLIRVRQKTKTGPRPVRPLYPEWAEAWNLGKPIYPEGVLFDAGMSNAKLGLKITGFFQRCIPWTAYNLRHCYARRCAEFDIAPNVAARLMGHSTRIHEKVYQAWIGERIFLDATERAIQNPNRPKPPLL